MYYILESTAERRTRRNSDIKKLFQQLTIDEGMPFMEAYEAVGYRFYLSAEQIRQFVERLFGHLAQFCISQPLVWV